MELSGDRHPQYEITWKLEDKIPETVDAEEWIAKKGIAAKGKKCAERGEVKSVRFIEPLHKPEDDIVEEAPEDIPDDSPEPDGSAPEGGIAAPAAGTPAKDEPAKEEPVDISVDDDIVELPKDVIDLKFEELTLF